jgi:LmbE family N-acetylglucosaminyl deacetylase
MEPQTFKALHPDVVLGIAAHPDDLDFGSGGTLATFAAAGADVYYLLLTDGSKGSADLSASSAELTRIRQSEQRAACAAIGGKDVFFLNHPDGELEVTLGLKAEIVKVIRTVKPEVVITMDPSMVYSMSRGFINHPDHRAAGQAALDAVFPLARDHLSFPELYAEGFQPHKVKTVLLTNFDKRNFYVDISESLDAKFAALKAHESQIPDYKAMKQRFTEFAADLGQASGYRYAEGFIRLDVMG